MSDNDITLESLDERIGDFANDIIGLQKTIQELVDAQKESLEANKVLSAAIAEAAQVAR